MNIKMILDIIAALGIIITVTTLVINAIYFTKKINKSVDKLSKRCDEHFNCLVQNEYDKLDIYKRLAALESEDTEFLHSIMKK